MVDLQTKNSKDNPHQSDAPSRSRNVLGDSDENDAVDMEDDAGILVSQDNGNSRNIHDRDEGQAAPSIPINDIDQVEHRLSDNAYISNIDTSSLASGYSLSNYMQTMRSIPGAFPVRGPMLSSTQNVTVNQINQMIQDSEDSIPHNIDVNVADTPLAPALTTRVAPACSPGSTQSSNQDSGSNQDEEEILPVAEIIHPPEDEIVAYAMVSDDDSNVVIEDFRHLSVAGKILLSKRRFLLILISGMALVIILTTTIYELTTSKKNVVPNSGDRFEPEKPVLESSLILALRANLLKTNITQERLLFDSKTPQYKSMAWLAHEDKNNVTSKFMHSLLFGPRDDTDFLNNTEHPILQRYIMVTLYFSTFGKGWTQQSHFLDGNHECTWRERLAPLASGIFCNNETQKIQQIHLFSLNLTGTVPDEIGNLPDLKVLFMGGNELTGSLPSTLSNLSKLTHLHICCNRLTGPLPYMGNFKNMEFFSVWMNKMTGTIGEDVGDLESIDTLHLGTNMFTGSLPSSIDNLRKMTRFYAKENNLSGTFPTFLFQLPFLAILSVQSNRLHGTIPNELSSLVLLEDLELHDNKLTGTIPDSIGDLRKLRTLNLSQNQLVGSIPTSLSSLSGLYEVDLSRNLLTGDANFLCPDSVNFNRLSYAVFKTDCLSSVECDCCSHCF